MSSAGTLIMPERDDSTDVNTTPMKHCKKLHCYWPHSRCTNGVYWLVDGEPHCRKHYDMRWIKVGEDIFKHKIVRLGGNNWG